MRYHEAHPPPWVTTYLVFILEYSWNILNKSIKKILECFLKNHHTIMLWFTLKIY
jgi:hypothetical protein